MFGPKARSARIIMALLGVTALIGTSVSAAAEDEGFVSLFNGKDLSGWKGVEELWSVEGGEIVGSTDGHEIPGNTFLISEKSYSDFVLRVSVKLRNHNSGIQFRSEDLGEFVAAGYQADIAAEYYGMLYEEKKRGFMPYWGKLSKEEQTAVRDAADVKGWNVFEITCNGDSVKMTLNGETVCDIIDPAGAKEGIVALQLHAGPEMEVRFKDISIKELD